MRYTTVMRYKAMAKKLMQVTGLADPIPAAAVLDEPARENGRGCAGDGVRDYGSYEISGQGETKVRAKEPVPELAVVRARAVWLEVVDGVRGSATALMERLDALTDPERVEDAAMLAGWRAKYENEITERMKSRWWRRMGRKREVG